MMARSKLLLPAPFVPVSRLTGPISRSTSARLMKLRTQTDFRRQFIALSPPYLGVGKAAETVHRLVNLPVGGRDLCSDAVVLMQIERNGLDEHGREGGHCSPLDKTYNC